MKKIASIILSVMMMLVIIIPSASAASEKQFYEEWYNDLSWKLGKCYYNWNDTGCLGCAGINEEFISAYEYYKSIYPNSQYLKQYDNLYISAVMDKAIYDSMSEGMHHVIGSGYQGPCSGHFGSMIGTSGDNGIYNFYCDDGTVVENVQSSTSKFGRLDNTRYENIGFMFWSIKNLNSKTNQWETVGYATTAVLDMNIEEYALNIGFATERYNYETPEAIMETFDGYGY